MENVTMRMDDVEFEVPSDTSEAAVAERAAAQEPAALPARPAELQDAAHTERLTLLAQARELLPWASFDECSTRQIQEAVLHKLDDKLDLTGKGDEYVRGRFDSAMHEIEKRRSPRVH
jgi:hypothetical protein